MNVGATGYVANDFDRPELFSVRATVVAGPYPLGGTYPAYDVATRTWGTAPRVGYTIRTDDGTEYRNFTGSLFSTRR